MSRVCTVCAHSETPEIDRLLLAGEISQREIADRFGLSQGAVSRHYRNHLPKVVAKAEEAARVEVAMRHEIEDLEHAIDVVQQLREINSASRDVLNEARDAGDGDLALKAVDRVHRQIELQAKLIGELDEGPSFNVVLSPRWIEIRTAIMDAVAGLPEAKARIGAAMERLEGGSGN